jgi:septal ring factor EnvC (AmiA/AmiB activator)
LDTLTKIFVVVLVVLVLVFCVVAINLITVPQNFRQELQQAKDRNSVLEATARTAKLSEEVALSKLANCKDELSDVRSAYEQQVSDLQAKLNNERLALADLQKSYSTAAAQLQGINASLDASIKLREKLSEQLEGARTTANQLRQEKMELSDALRNAQARADRLSGRIRILEEQLAASQRRVTELEDRLIAAGAAEEPSEGATMPQAEVTAEVTTVDGNIVGINAGSAQGVEQGMRMIIYRDAKLVAQLDIDEVDVASAAGVVTYRQRDPRPGDKVSTSLD